MAAGGAASTPPHCGTSGGATTPGDSSSQCPCARAGALRSRGPVAASSQTQSPLLCNVPGPDSKSLGKGQDPASHPWGTLSWTRREERGHQRGQHCLGPGGTWLQDQEVWRKQRTRTDRENLEGPSGTRLQSQGRCCRTEPAETSAEERRTPGRALSPVGAPEDTAGTGKQQRWGWEWPGETCSPALCCMTVIKLLPFAMVPRGGVNQLLIKTDGSEVASPEPLYPWNFGKSHRGARSHRADPRLHRAGGTAGNTRRWRGQMFSVGVATVTLGRIWGGIGGCREPEQPRGGKGRPEGLREVGKQREEEKSSSNCPLKFMKAVKKQSAERAPGCC